MYAQRYHFYTQNMTFTNSTVQYTPLISNSYGNSYPRQKKERYVQVVKVIEFKPYKKKMGVYNNVAQQHGTTPYNTLLTISNPLPFDRNSVVFNPFQSRGQRF